MSESSNHFVIFGGAGYLGGYLVKRIAEEANNKITIITRNKSKQILFKGRSNIYFESDVNSISNERIYVVNLAYGLDMSMKVTKKLNEKLFKSIDQLCSRNQVSSIIHVSSIVLSEGNNQLSVKLDKSDSYKFAKSYGEYEIQKFSKKFGIPSLIIRSGNIVGPGSIWVIKICKNLIENKPIATQDSKLFSNATYVENLADYLFTSALEVSESFKIINYNEFGSRPWNDFISILSAEIGVDPVKWKSRNIKEMNISFKKDFRNTFQAVKKAAVLKFYKGPISNKKVNRILELFNIKNLDKKTKTGIKKIDNDQYPDAQEYALLKVFMNDTEVPFSKVKVRYDFKHVSNELINWARISGYSSIL